MGLNQTLVNDKGFGASSSTVSIINTAVEPGEEWRKVVFQLYTYMNIHLTLTWKLPLALFLGFYVH